MTRRDARADGHPGQAEGFVLPIVILLMLVVGSVAAVMLTRADAQARDVRRQVDAYQVYHGVQGLRQVLDGWVSQQQVRTITELLDDDGLAMEIEPGDGTVLRVHLFDAQGLLRSETAGMPEEQAADLELVNEELQRLVGPDRAALYTREAGPFQLSINAAPATTLEALASALAGTQVGPRFAGEVMERRERNQRIDRTELNSVMSSAGIPEAERARLNALLAVEPSLWEFVIDVQGSGPAAANGLLARYRAMVVFVPSTAAAGQAYERPSPFLSWESVDLSTYNGEPPLPSTPAE